MLSARRADPWVVVDEFDAKPERILREVIGEAVRETLDRVDAELGLRYFCSAAALMDRHYVVCAIQLPGAALASYPTIPLQWRGRAVQDNLALRAISLLLGEARGREGSPVKRRKGFHIFAVIDATTAGQ